MRLRYMLSRCDLFRAGVWAMLRQGFLHMVLIPFLAFGWWSTFTWDENRGEPLPLRIVVATLAATVDRAFLGALADPFDLVVQWSCHEAAERSGADGWQWHMSEL